MILNQSVDSRYVHGRVHIGCLMLLTNYDIDSSPPCVASPPLRTRNKRNHLQTKLADVCSKYRTKTFDEQYLRKRNDSEILTHPLRLRITDHQESNSTTRKNIFRLLCTKTKHCYCVLSIFAGMFVHQSDYHEKKKNWCDFFSF